MEFLLFLGKNYLQVFDLSDNCEKVYINGEEDIAYDITKAYKAIADLKVNIKDQYNLGDTNAISFQVLKNSDDLVNEVMLKEIGNNIQITYELNNILKNIIYSLTKNDKLMIGAYGVNYDGHCYKLEKEKLITKDFNLLAYTLADADIINSIKYSKK